MRVGTRLQVTGFVLTARIQNFAIVGTSLDKKGSIVSAIKYTYTDLNPPLTRTRRLRGDDLYTPSSAECTPDPNGISGGHQKLYSVEGCIFVLWCE